MDDETAEIELLEQNLHKTHQISMRMTAILNGFDTRLAKLEKSILPLYTSSQVLNRRASNIEKTLVKIDEVASSREGVAVEEAFILRGPQPGDLEGYKDALARLNTTIAFKPDDPDTADSARLVETGAKKLAQLYTKLVAEGSSGNNPALSLDMSSVPFPPALLSALLPLVSFLRTLPVPATHPSHPAAPTIFTTLKDAQRGYAEMRGTWCKKAEEKEAKRILERVEQTDTIEAGKAFGGWVDSLVSVAEIEYTLLQDLTPMTSSQSIASTYTLLLNPILNLFSSTLNSLVGIIKRSLHQYTFLALASYERLLKTQPRFDSILSLRGSSKESNEYKDVLNTLRSVCLRSFPEFLADIKMAALGKTGQGEISTTLADFTLATVKYMEMLPEVQGAAAAALTALGDGNWKMGEGVAVQKSKLGEGDETVILQHYVYDVITTTINSIDAISKTAKRPAYGSIFAINNISYIYKYILTQPEHEEVTQLLSKPTQAAIQSGFRTAKAAYFDANFSPLMQALTDDPKEKASKAVAKEKFARFYDLLDDVIERHRFARVLEEDPEDRAAIGEDIIKLVVPSLQRFMQKYREKDQKNSQKYIRLSTTEVESQLKALYR